jgi:hypothetical protein
LRKQISSAISGRSELSEKLLSNPILKGEILNGGLTNFIGDRPQL